MITNEVIYNKAYAVLSCIRDKERRARIYTLLIGIIPVKDIDKLKDRFQ